MNIFLDTNVVIDYLSGREPFCSDVRPVFRNYVENNWSLFCAPMTFTTMEYVLKKIIPHDTLMEKFAMLRKVIDIVPSDSLAIDRAIYSEFKDFEDAVQHYTAISGKADVIITRNTGDFIPYNKLEVLTPKEFLAKYQK